MRIKKSRNAMRVIIISVLFLFSSCGSGKSEGEPTQPQTDDNVKIISFDQSSIPINNSVYFEQVPNNNNEISLAVKVKGGLDVYGSALEITYDSNKVIFMYSNKGDFLGPSADTFFYVRLNKDLEGALLIGIDKKKDVKGADGDGVLFTIVFKLLTAPTETAIEFNKANSCLKSSNVDNPNIPGTLWIGGILSYK